MNSDTVIKVEGLSKKFCRSLRRSMYYGTIDITRSMLSIPFDKEVLRKNEFWALDDINFELKRGETLGLIGKNGCGKSTLLRIINGIFPPDKGKIIVRGRIGALIAVGAGFHPHMTGKENIFLNGTILGMSKQEINKKFDSIVDFAGIGNFLDAPASTYSSGMNIRLGFSIAIHTEPDILLVDEILAVGDMDFQAKSYTAIKKLISEGTALLFVSHSMGYVLNNCEKSLLINLGKTIAYDESKKVIPMYEILNSDGVEALQEYVNKDNGKRDTFIDFSSTREYKFYGKNGNTIKIPLKFHRVYENNISEIQIGLALSKLDGIMISGWASCWDNKLYNINKETVIVEINLDMFLSGIYILDISIRDKNLAFIEEINAIKIYFENSRKFIGTINPRYIFGTSSVTKFIRFEEQNV